MPRFAVLAAPTQIGGSIDESVLQQRQTLSNTALGDRGTQLKAMLRDPALIIWLDGQKNTAQAPKISRSPGRSLCGLHNPAAHPRSPLAPAANKTVSFGATNGELSDGRYPSMMATVETASAYPTA